MKKYLPLILFSILISSCKKEEKHKFKPSFASVTVDTLLTDSISIRALAIDGNKVWYAGSKGKYGWVSLSGGKDFNGVASQDTIFPEFRAIAQTATDVFILSAASPALLFKISKDGKSTRLVYIDTAKTVFYDCLKIDGKNGIAFGDPQNGYPDLLKTDNGGEKWYKESKTISPKLSDGEAAFAASNTNIVIKDGKTWIATGGKKSRVLFKDKDAKNWQEFISPIVQGSEATGPYSIDFYDTEVGFMAGGDYTEPDSNAKNKALTTDGGKTWKLVADGSGPGYISCVQFVPGSDGYELVTTGGNGIFYSYDRGVTWKKILNDTNLHTLQFADAKTLIAAGQNRIVLIKLK
ncbi:oxidoreductase [Flavobacterium akiainvivens]|uniref:Oxidoreductase n=1 Tax=Flavobacterium akiainvivens TaxID=1202724 RepID=A0A0M8MGB4_9FLAO|nr:oxidoreductase [Flavobacterium akiainvivens]KOS05167.1 oxidoreductase [Flavobacterium akiainvivens]SFQ50976.1 Uncharacterized protein SAMN05444144_106148 [Flavobacterium akiainvivens]